MVATKGDCLRRAVRHAINKCLERTYDLEADFRNPERNRPQQQHQHLLCEKCEWGKIDCTTGNSLTQFEEPHQSRNSELKPLPREFEEYDWKDWDDLATRLYPSEKVRVYVNKAWHAVASVLKTHHEALKIDLKRHKGIFEGGSRQKGTQLPWSDYDLVIFVKDFPRVVDPKFFKRRFRLILKYLEEACQPGNPFGLVSFQIRESSLENRYSRTFDIELDSVSAPHIRKVKFDVLLGGPMDSPTEFLNLKDDVIFHPSVAFKVELSPLDSLSRWC